MYGSLESWRAYAAERGDNAPSDASDQAATAALVRASDHIRHRYVANLLPGYDDTLPIVEEATYVAASLELKNPGFFAKTFTPSEQKVLTAVGEVRWTVTGKAGAKYASAPVSTLIEAMFEPYVRNPNDAQFLLRSVGG